MKKSILIFMSLLFCFSVYSQDKLNKISINPVSLIFAGMNSFEYERGFLDGRIGVSFYYGKTANGNKAFAGYKVNAAEESVSCNIYFNNLGRSAFWLGPRLSFTSASIYDDDNPSNYATNIGTLGFCLGLGGQLILGGFYISPYFAFGAALTDDLWGEAVYHGNLKSSPLIINYGLKTGIAF